MARRGLKTTPSWPQEGLRRLQEVDFDLQFTIFFALQQCFSPTWPKMALRGPKMAPRGFKMSPSWSKMAPRVSKLASNWPQDASNLDQDGRERP